MGSEVGRRIKKMIVTPAPNKYSPETSIGRDFLGQQSVIQYMANRCLPSFTNSTKKLRYYSFWAWAFKMLQKNFHNLKDGNNSWYYLMKLETALMVSNRLRNPQITGMPGIQGIPVDLDKINKSKDSDLINLYSEKKRATSYAAVQYSPSLGTLNVVKKDGDRYQILTFGNRLGDIFDSKIVNNKGYSILTDPKSRSLPKKYLKELSDAFNLEKISKEEKEIYKEIIQQDEFGLKLKEKVPPRVSTSLLILDIVKNKKIKYPKDILSHLWMSNYSPPDTLKDILGGWRVVEARRHYQFAIESILSSFCQYLISLDNKESTFEGFIKTVLKNYGDLEIRNINVNELKDDIRYNKPLSSFHEKLITICEKEKISEETIIKSIISTANRFNWKFNNKFIFYALVLILLLYEKLPILERTNSNKALEFLKRPFDSRHSFITLSRLLNSWMHLPFSEAILKIFSELSLKLHLGVAQDKWLQTGNFTFQFIRAEPIGFKFTARRIIHPNRTNNKILAYFEILVDLGLIREEDFYKITREGNVFHSKYL